MRSIWALLILFILASCTREQPPASGLFQYLFPDEHYLIRFVQLGMPMDSVQLLEEGSPKYSDSLGFVYTLGLGPGRSGYIEYYNQPGSERLSAVIVNMRCKDQVEAAELHQEIETLFRKRYDVPSGYVGDLTWKPEGMEETHLILESDKRSLTINFVTP